VFIEAKSSHLPDELPRSHVQLPHHESQHYFLYSRDPGVSDPVLGGAIVASLTVGILAMVALAVCMRRRRSRYGSGHSDDSDVTSVDNPPPSSSEEPKNLPMGIRKVPPKTKGEEPQYQFVRRKPPREQSQHNYPDAHDPLSTHY
jgi:hypothetical protein